MVPTYITEFSQELIGKKKELIEIICISGQQTFSIMGQITIETLWSLLQLFTTTIVEERQPWTIHEQMNLAVFQEDLIYKMGYSFPSLDQCTLNDA